MSFHHEHQALAAHYRQHLPSVPTPHLGRHCDFVLLHETIARHPKHRATLLRFRHLAGEGVFRDIVKGLV
jgi:hypothetical protein